MAIYAYIGIPGSGKSYECVKSVIVAAVLKGRRVVTNIDGLKPDKIYDYCERKYKADASSLGQIVHVTDTDVMSDGFFPYKEDDAVGYVSSSAFCKAGDLICLDEVWRFWLSDKNLNKQHQSFLAEHRHFSDAETNTTIDLVFMSQSLDNVARFLKTRIETTFKMSKLSSLGLKNRYRVDVFSGYKTFKSAKTHSLQCKYDSEIFQLYDSTNAGTGKETSVDSRQNIFAQKKLWFYLIGFICMFCFSCYLIYSFFASDDTKNKKIVVNQHAISSLPVVPQKPVIPSNSTEWRISGELFNNGLHYVTIINTSGDIRLLSRSVFTGFGNSLTGTVDGQTVTYFTGHSK